MHVRVGDVVFLQKLVKVQYNGRQVIQLNNAQSV